jgi:hypothetical protein
MPVAPTDPRAFTRDDLPQPPTMNNYAGTSPNAGRAGMGPRLNAVGTAENGGHRLPNQKAFENFRATPATSPFLLMDGPTNNGTVSAYAAYVRPAQQQQQQPNQEVDRTTNGLAGPDQPAPSYPPAFLNYGSYYPAGR